MNKRRSLRFRALFPILAILFALISGLGLALEGNNRAQAVVNGIYVDNSDPYPFSSLGLMHADAGWEVNVSHGFIAHLQAWCGATLIAPDWVLTAEHCLDKKNNNQIVGQYNAGQIKVTFGGTLSNGSGGQTPTVSKILREPGYDPYHNKNDLALLELSSPINGITLLTVGGSCPEWTIGSPVLAAGWGEGSANSDSPPMNAMQEAALKFEGTMDNIEVQRPGEYVFTSERPINFVGPTREYGNLKYGDSGDGLLFKEPNGQYVLLGVLHNFAPAPNNSNAQWDMWERTDATSANFSFIKPYLQDPAAACPPSSNPIPPPPIQQPPAIPTGLHVTGRTASSVGIAWNAVPGANGYRVYNGGTQIAQVTGTSATVTGLKDNTSYTYTVAAYNGAGQSAQNVPLTVQTLPTWRFAVLSQNVYDDQGNPADLGHLRPGQHGRIVITVRNTGSATWTNNAANPVMLGTDHPRDRASAIMTTGWISSSRPAYLSEAQVPPGGQGTFAFPFAAPSSAGTVTEYFTAVAQGISWFDDVGLYLKFTVVPVVGVAFAPGTDSGQWVVATDGGVFAYSGAGFYGSMGGQHLNQPIVGIAATSTGKGYWLVAADGGVFAFGDAGFYGSMVNQHLNQPVVGITATSTGKGYWLVAADGGVFAFGDAGFYGSMGANSTSRPVVGITTTPHGYFLVNVTGAVQSFNSPQAPPIPDTLNPQQQLNPGDQLVSSNGRYVLVMQGDGNLVEYETGGSAVWASGTSVPGTVFINQADGNFVLVAPGNHPVWATGTNAPGTVLTVQDDGNVVTYAPGHLAVWATNTRV